MAFKTKEQIFGDNGVNGLQVPVSVSNPPGTAAANRGVGFGEGVTAAIANRTGYELAKNDEDINARVTDIETSGLDSAYRGGLSATPGSGRVVTIDGGAVEAAGTAALDDEANALLRARVFSGDVGLDVVGSSFGAILNRIPLALNNNTVLPASTAAVLNPAGAGVDLVEVTGPQRFATTADTDLILGFDFLQIAGTANNDGLYAIVAVTTDFRVQVVALNPGLPAFPVTTAATVTLHRAATRVEDGSLYLSPTAGTPTAAAVDVVSDADATLSAGDALRASVAQLDGSTSPVFRVARDGSVSVSFDNVARSAAEIRQLAAAPLFIDAPSTRVDSSAAPLSVMKYAGLDYLNGVPTAGAPMTWPELVFGKLNFAFAPPNPVLHDIPVAVNLVAATNFIEFQVGGKTTTVGLFSPNTMVELTGTTGGAYDGFYHVVGHNQSAGNGRVHLSSLDGGVLSFPADTATARLYVASRRHLVGIPTVSYTYDPTTPPHADIFDAVKSFDVVHSFNGNTFVEGAFVVHSGTSVTTPANRNGSTALFAVDDLGGVFMMDARVRGDLKVSDGTDTAVMNVAGGNLDITGTDVRVINTLRANSTLEVGASGESAFNVVGGTVLTLSGAADDLHVEGGLEVDGTANFDGTADFDGIVDMSSTVQLSGASNELTYSGTRTRTVRVSALSIVPSAAASWLPTYYLSQLNSDTGVYAVDLSPYLPTGATLKGVTARVKPGFGRADGSNMKFEVYKITSDDTTVQIGVTDLDDNGTGAQTLSIGTVTEVVARSTTRYSIRMESGSDASTALREDTVYYFDVTFQDPGPRNF